MSPIQRKIRNVDCSVQALRSHISLAQEERQYYRDIVDGAKASLDEAEGKVHYTFDFAQQLELPFHTRRVHKFALYRSMDMPLLNRWLGTFCHRRST